MAPLQFVLQLLADFHQTVVGEMLRDRRHVHALRQAVGATPDLVRMGADVDDEGVGQLRRQREARQAQGGGEGVQRVGGRKIMVREPGFAAQQLPQMNEGHVGERGPDRGAEPAGQPREPQRRPFELRGVALRTLFESLDAQERLAAVLQADVFVAEMTDHRFQGLLALGSIELDLPLGLRPRVLLAEREQMRQFRRGRRQAMFPGELEDRRDRRLPFLPCAMAVGTLEELAVLPLQHRLELADFRIRRRGRGIRRRGSGIEAIGPGAVQPALLGVLAVEERRFEAVRGLDAGRPGRRRRKGHESWVCKRPGRFAKLPE
ncbi:hypothetical protein ACFJIX_14110 [Roseateles sp. UC29_93]|uniref:hypothetical protein n=1 Tax=Roseateles sp. UC29_93 TaxID=3350177 RepID=UPI003670B024